MDGITAALTAFFGFAGKVMDKLPDWIQRKKEEYLKLKTAYDKEWSRPTSERDGRKADHLRMELETFNEIFWRELEQNTAVKK